MKIFFFKRYNYQYTAFDSAFQKRQHRAGKVKLGEQLLFYYQALLSPVDFFKMEDDKVFQKKILFFKI